MADSFGQQVVPNAEPVVGAGLGVSKNWKKIGGLVVLLVVLPLALAGLNLGFRLPRAASVDIRRPRITPRPPQSPVSLCAVSGSGYEYRLAGSYSLSQPTNFSGKTLIVGPSGNHFISDEGRVYKVNASVIPSPFPTISPAPTKIPLGWMGACVPGGSDCEGLDEKARSKYDTSEWYYTCNTGTSCTVATGLTNFYDVQFAGVAASTFDSAGNFYVPDWTQHRISKFGPDGSLIGWMGSCVSGSDCVGGQANGGFVCNNITNPNSCVRSTDSGLLAGTGNYQLSGPKAVYAKNGASGPLYVADSGSDRVKAYSLNGAYLPSESWLINGGNAYDVTAIVYNPVNSLIYVGYQHSNSNWYVWIANSTGASMTGSTWPNGYPLATRKITGLSVDSFGNVYVVSGDTSANIGSLSILSSDVPSPSTISNPLNYVGTNTEFYYKDANVVRASSDGNEIYLAAKRCNNSNCSSTDTFKAVYKFVCDTGGITPTPTSSVPTSTPTRTPTPTPPTATVAPTSTPPITLPICQEMQMGPAGVSSANDVQWYFINNNPDNNKYLHSVWMSWPAPVPPSTSPYIDNIQHYGSAVAGNPATIWDGTASTSPFNNSTWISGRDRYFGSTISFLAINLNTNARAGSYTLVTRWASSPTGSAQCQSSPSAWVR